MLPVDGRYIDGRCRRTSADADQLADEEAVSACDVVGDRLPTGHAVTDDADGVSALYDPRSRHVALTKAGNQLHLRSADQLLDPGPLTVKRVEDVDVLIGGEPLHVRDGKGNRKARSRGRGHGELVGNACRRAVEVQRVGVVEFLLNR